MNAVKSRVINLGDDYKFLTQVTIDEITNAKILTITSPHRIFNETCDDLIIQFYDKKNLPINILELKANKSESVESLGSIPGG